MMRKAIRAVSCLGLICLASAGALQAQVWGVNPLATGSELISINPFTGVIQTAFSLGSTIATGNTEIGLAGWGENELFYTNADLNNGMVYVLDPANGSTIRSFSVSGGWEIDGIGYWSDGTDSYLYTSGCSVDDMHRYDAADGAGPQFYWSDAYDPRAVAGDYGGKIFTYAQQEGTWGIYEVNPTVNAALTWFAASPSTDVVGMAYDGMYLYLSDTNNRLYTMNNSGNVVSTLQMEYTLYGLASTAGTGEPLPEPASILVLGVGMLGLMGAGVRRRKQD